MDRRSLIAGFGLAIGTAPLACGGGDPSIEDADGGGSDSGNDDEEGEEDEEDDGSGEGEDDDGTDSGADSSAGDDSEDTSDPELGECDEIAPTSQVSRLTNIQYDRTVRDLLGVTSLTASNGSLPSTLLATDQGGGLTDLGWSAYQSVAGMIAIQVMEDPALRSNFLKCDPADDDCLEDTIVEFGHRAFRRPLTESEIARFSELVSKGEEITESGAPDEIARALLYTFLISPSFLQRGETSEDGVLSGAENYYVLSSHEVASRLSYMLWGTMPDEDLFEAAAEGELETPDQILAQARRMLEDERAREMVASFHRDYLFMKAGGRWDTTAKDADLYPTFSAEQVPWLASETVRMFDYITFEQEGSFRDFLLTDVAFVNQATAPLYDLDPSDFGEDLEMVRVEDRPGFLTRAGFLSAYSYATSTSPILRGAYITKEIIGVDVPAPPPGIDQSLPEGAEDLETIREQVTAQTSVGDCKSCHDPYINPPGFALENFNAVGAWQTHEAFSGAEINPVADVTVVAGEDPVTVSTPTELMELIAGSPTAMEHYARRWISYAYQRQSPLDECATARIAETMMTNEGYTVLDLISDLTQTESFRVRAVEGDQ